MILTPNDLLRRILDTKAVSIWDHEKGPIFWYAASIPGPFYVNTELVLGKELSSTLLQEITSIIADTPEPAIRAKLLEALIMESYEKDSFFKNITETLVAKLKDSCPEGSYDAISGGERRDWLFSIPMAKLLGIKHIYLFKNGDLFCAEGIESGERAVHVADLINNAASHFDAWLPALAKHGLTCPVAMAINSRGHNGVDRLKANGQNVLTLNSVTIEFFESCCEQGLVSQAVVDELRIFFESPEKWASTYLMGKPALFNVAAIDDKSFSRLCTFFEKDPWNLRANHEAFFKEMEAAIAARQGA
ncbi:MAG: hypothetical protein AB7S81_04845 [Bdellovibrionales bacterium]